MESANGKAESWRQRIEDQQASGQSVRGWCSTHGIAEHSFYAWRRRLNPPAGIEPPVDGQARIGLTRVKIIQTPAAEGFCLRLGGGRELILPASLAMGRVAELIRALEGKPSRLETTA